MQQTLSKPLIFIGLALLVFLVFSDAAQASSGGGGGLPYEGFLNQIRSSVTGPFAFTMSILGIVVGGAMLIFGGDISGFFKLLITLVLIISVLVGANNFLASFFGVGAEIGEVPTQTIQLHS